jgi:cytolysin-activating lysine-acyltransferase
MSQSSNGNGSHGPAGAANAPGDSPFNKPAPEGAAKKVSEVPGEIVWLMSQSPLHKQFFISDLEWLVMTPVLLQQFRMFYDKDKPIGVVLWATVNEEVEERLAAGTSRLRPQDWKSGDRAWVVEVIAPFGGAEEMVKDLKTKVFPTRELKFLMAGPLGHKEVKVI